MKKVIIFGVMLTTLLTGCKESFLDQEPPLAGTEGEVFTDISRMEAAVRGLYANFKNTSADSYMGGKSYLVFDNRGDDFVNISQNLVVLFDTYNMQVGSTYGENETTWSQGYATINKCNAFLENLEKSKEIAGDKYDQFKAEAEFVRAISYYYLISLYGMPYVLEPSALAIPLRLKYEKDLTNNAHPLSSVNDVYVQILKDLNGMAALPVAVKSYKAVTRATQAAANMLKMRVFMATQNWTEAVKAGKEVTGYALEREAAAPFSSPYFTGENIFSLPMDPTNRPNTQQSLAEYMHDGKIMVIDDAMGIMSKANYSLSIDQRIAAFKGAGRIYKKYKDAQNKLEWVPIFRYAETLLNLAECHYNLGDMNGAKAALKQVRSRSIDPSVDPLKIDDLSGDALKEAIYNERRLELMGEAVRSIDIHRRGENFVKGSGGTTVTINVAPSLGKSGYIWPLPQSEINLNPDVK